MAHPPRGAGGAPAGQPVHRRSTPVYAPADGRNLLVIRKENRGRPADAVNTGVNAARYPLICRIDADTYLDETALLSAAKPFIEDPARVVAAGSTIRVANEAMLFNPRYRGVGCLSCPST